MTHPPLTPVFVGLRAGLHVLFAVLVVLVVARAVVTPAPSATVVVQAAALSVTYLAGQLIAPLPGRPRWLSGGLWLGILTVQWAVLLWSTSDAAYLVFPLFFLHLHLLGRWWGSAVIVVTTAIAVSALGLHNGWSVGGVVGPVVGAGVALLIGLGYQALAREHAEREELMRELIATRGQLAATEHESGVLAERSRLAREIHDTVAQGLSSIQMLLHAAERADPGRPGIEHLRLARETAAGNLAEARRFIRELTPPQLDDRGLGGALRRLAASHWAAQGLPVAVRVSPEVALPMHLQTALLRIAQGAVANVIQHAHAAGAEITLTMEDDRLRFTVADDGDGFDPARNAALARTDSFGLQATRERVDQLGGVLTVESSPGHGTTVTVALSLEPTS